MDFSAATGTLSFQDVLKVRIMGFFMLSQPKRIKGRSVEQAKITRAEHHQRLQIREKEIYQSNKHVST